MTKLTSKSNGVSMKASNNVTEKEANGKKKMAKMKALKKMKKDCM